MSTNMTIIYSLLARADPNEAGPSCSPFTLQNSVCVGDFIAILVCSVSGLGFLFWSIHAIRKMRSEFPFTYDPEKELDDIAARRARDPFANPANVDQAFVVQQGVTPSPETLERVRARMTLTHPAAYAYSEPNDALPGVTMPRTPPPAGTPSSRTLSHSPPQYGSLYRDGAHGEKVNGKYTTDTRSPRAMEMPLYRPDSSYRLNGNLKMYDTHH